MSDNMSGAAGFELHCHSWHSKGKKIPWEGISPPGMIARTLKRKGISGFAITDHDSIKSWKEASGEARRLGLVHIPAVEISTASGHVIGLGITESVPAGMPVEETVDEIRSQGGIAVAPHPFDIRNEGVKNEFSKCDAVETFNSLNLTKIENMIAARKARRLRMPAVGGSDAHLLQALGATVNYIDASDADSALKKIKKGKVLIEGKYIPVPVIVWWIRERMRMSYADIEEYIDRNYSAPRANVSRFFLNKFVKSDSPFWNFVGNAAVNLSIAYSIPKNIISKFL